MAEKSVPSSLKRLTQQRFQEEVARELGINPTSAAFPKRDVTESAHELNTDDEELPKS